MHNTPAPLANADIIDLQPIPLPPLHATNPASIAAFITEATLAIQGVPALFTSDTSLPALALGIALAYDASPAAYLRGTHGGHALLFMHTEQNLIAGLDIDTSVHATLRKLSDHIPLAADVAAPPLKHTLNLTQLWSATGGTKGSPEETCAFLERVAQAATPTMVLELSGTIPPLPLLAAIIALRPTARRIMYTVDGATLQLFS